MTLIVHDCEQGSPEWFAIRAGKPTASEFATVLAKGEGKTRRAYMLKLAGEILTGELMANYSNADMLRGKEQEDDARNKYELLHDVELQRVGFLEETDVKAGASPDALVGTKAILEIKCCLAHVQIDRLKRGAIPPEHIAQCQGGLWVSGREQADFVSYCPKLPLFVKPAFRDEPYIRTLAKEVALFNEELAETVAFVERYGRPSELREVLGASLAATG